ncbi:TIM barrel protein [Tersicoccus phoenicis]|nr:TIM barrel protein [Tersicoccus phoenicis]
MRKRGPRIGPDAPDPGALLDGASSLDDVIVGCREQGVTVIGLAAGPGQALGIHLGARVRDEYRRRIREAGLRLITVTAPTDLLAERPDEGVAADIADYLDLAADVGAESLTLTLTHAQTIPRGAGEPGDERAVRRLRALADHAAALDVAAVLQNAPAVPGIAQVIDLIDLLHRRLGQPNEERSPAPAAAPPAGHDRVAGDPAAGGADGRERTGSLRHPRSGQPRDGDPGTGDPGRPVVIGAAWDVAMSTAAGENLATGWARARGLLLRSHGHVVVPDAATAHALHRAVPASAPVPVLVTEHTRTAARAADRTG